MKFDIKKNIQNVIGVVMLVAVLLAVAFTSNTKKGDRLK